jgi:ankyrin repeat protein
MDAVGDFQCTALGCAAVHGWTDVVKLLLDAGADPTLGRALHLAMIPGFAEVVRLLLAAGVSPDSRDLNGCTSAMVVTDACVEALGELIRFGVDLSLRSPEGSTALQLAAGKGHAMTVRMLLGAGADPLSCTSGGDTALGLAVANGHTAVVKEFIAFGVDPNALGVLGRERFYDFGQPGRCDRG